MRLSLEAVVLTVCIIIGVYIAMTLRAVTTDSRSTCTVEHIDPATSRTTCR